MKIKSICMDLDGTIFDVSERDAYCRYEALRQIGYDVPFEKVKQHYHRGIGIMGILQKLNINLTKEQLDEYIEARFHSFTNMRNEKRYTRLITGANDILAVLSKKYPLILVTSRGRLPPVEEELSWFNLQPFFNLIVTREVTAKYHEVKEITVLPFHEQRMKLYTCVLGLTTLVPENVVCIGDSLGELIPAKTLKMITVGVLTGVDNKKDLEKVADIVVQDITQINEVVNRIGAER